MRNTLEKEQVPQNLGESISDETLRKYCDKNYHQILSIIAKKMHQEKVQQEKLKAVKAHLHDISSQEHRAEGGISKKGSDLGRLTAVAARTLKVTTRAFAFEKHRNKRVSSQNTEALSESEGSAGGHWKSRPKRQKSSVEDDLSQPWERSRPLIVNKRSRFHHGNIKKQVKRKTSKREASETSRRRSGGRKAVASNQRAEAKQWKRSGKSSQKGKNLRKGQATTDTNGTTMRKGDEEHSTSAWMNFMVVRSLSPYNGVIRRPGIRRIRAIPSTALRMLKFPAMGGTVTLRSSKIIPLECTMVSGPRVSQPVIDHVKEEKIQIAISPKYPKQTIMIGSTLTEEGRKELCHLLRHNLDIFSWMPADITGVLWHIAKNRLNICEGCLPIRQKKRGQAPARNKTIFEEVEKLVDADIMKEVHYHAGYAYKGYHQIKMAEEDEEKTAFITSQGIFCYSKMPFRLKNAGATNQRLVDKAFQKQIGQNLEVYVDDLVIKSQTEKEVIKDIEETFKTLREINMKLNPKKCALGMRECTFLGYKVDAYGLRVCPNKAESVINLPSPKCLKDVQKLNGKLASLNRFLSKSAEKYLPFFKTLKKYTKKSDFQWTTEAEMAFKQTKRLIVALPMLTALKEKEELVMYLAAAKETISEVLMTDRDSGPRHCNHGPRKDFLYSIPFDT
nr:reverse transcriptase domain-containing protein [Tanacetum cinerariifolium]